MRNKHEEEDELLSLFVNTSEEELDEQLSLRLVSAPSLVSLRELSTRENPLLTSKGKCETTIKKV